MRPEEAVRILKRYKKSIESDFTKPEETEPVQAYTAAIQALEKQVEKKPTRVTENWAGKPIDRCGDCGRILRGGYEYNFCHSCGRKIYQEAPE